VDGDQRADGGSLDCQVAAATLTEVTDSGGGTNDFPA
jgi:hypothetical protein